MANFNLLNNQSKLIITNDFEQSISYIKDEKDEKNYIYVYPQQNILVDDVKNIITHSYLSSEQIEYIVIAIESINIQSQNALLKILEEPPYNKYFLLLASNKNIFLPTILSRLSIVNLPKIDKQLLQLNFNISKLTLNDIYKYIKDNKNISKNDALSTIEALFAQIYEKNIILPYETLNLFDKSIKLINLNSKPIHILTSILLHLQTFIQKPI
jgi:DNA polymerase-3 subunit delta'